MYVTNDIEQKHAKRQCVEHRASDIFQYLPSDIELAQIGSMISSDVGILISEMCGSMKMIMEIKRYNAREVW